MRGVNYVLKIDNLEEFPDHAFIVYPTSNFGYGYVVETSPVNLIRLMMRESSRRRPSRLYAMSKAALAKHDPDAPRYPHADDRTPVMVVDEPPKSALRADAAIEPPALVPEDSKIVRIERTFHISRLDRRAFELELVKEETIEGEPPRVPKIGDLFARAQEDAAPGSGPAPEAKASGEPTKERQGSDAEQPPASIPEPAPAATPREDGGCRISAPSPLRVLMPWAPFLLVWRRRK